MKTLTVISPVYNEAEVLESFYRELSATLRLVSERYKTRILFVLDRSSDGSLDILKRLATEDRTVGVLSLSARFGHQMALLAGIDHTDADVIIMMDSDLQHPPSLISVLLEKHEEGYDIVNTVRSDEEQLGLLKRTSSRLFYFLINRISSVPISERAADFRLISRRVAKVFQKGIRERNQFIRGLVNWVGFEATTVPFRVGARAAGQSKYSTARLMRFAVHGIVSFSKRPLQAAVIFGFVFAGLGLLNALITLIQYFVYSSLPSGWTTLAMLISIFSGVQLIFLGIIGEYIGAIFDEVKGRPHYIVEERVNVDSD
jgi:glycosyltransferase involved in cell wall biosynthesis